MQNFLRIGLSLLLVSCSGPAMDPATTVGKNAILDQVTVLLTSKQCAAAADLIEPLYQSNNTDNNVRLARAAAQGCRSGLSSFFTFILTLGGMNLAPPNLWQSLAEIFYSTNNTELDSRIAANWVGTETLMSVLNPGVVVPTNFQVNADTYNVGSINVGDRTDDANFYLILHSMALIGNTQNRYGAPDPGNSYKKANALPWDDAGTAGQADSAFVTDEGCAYAGAIMNMVESIAAVNDALAGTTVGNVLNELISIDTDGNGSKDATFVDYMNTQCGLGCAACNPTAGSCTSCPLKMRDRALCMTDTDSLCAASWIAGELISINTDTGWLGP